MSIRYKGGILSATPPTLVAGAGASGAWTLEQQMQATAAGNWPVNGPFYIEDVFSTYLYTGNGSTQTITNGIDLSTKGGMVWLKRRSGIANNQLYDTTRGATKLLVSNETTAQSTVAQGLTSFGTTGFTLGTDGTANTSGDDYASWTFRKQPKFFDIVTYTGTGVARTISHDLGSVPGCIIVKRTDATGNWPVYHRSLTSAAYSVWVNWTDPQYSSPNNWNNTDPTSSVFSVSTHADVNASGGTYVAYLFAHNAGGFGLTGTDNVISCGSFDGTANTTVTLGYEPQWIMFKNTTSLSNWQIVDNMRGMPVGSADKQLMANLANAESDNSLMTPTATGFTWLPSAAGNTYIYIAIRRGPMKVPTSGTSVFSPITTNAATNTTQTTNFPIDSQWQGPRGGGYVATIVDRLRGNSSTPSNTAAWPTLITLGTGAENTASFADSNNWNNTGFDIASLFGGSSTVYWSFRRAPGFFDVVCYSGTGAASTKSHNLGVAPELMIVKRRNGATNWPVYSSSLGAGKFLSLNLTNAFDFADFWNNTSPTASQFSTDSSSVVNASGGTYVAYLFATLAGVSKVGSYTGTGATQTIDCGFSGGARFVLVKRTDTTGDWYVWDTARGMVAGTDPSLLLDSSAAEVNANSVYTTSVGFQIVSTAAGINASGGNYIFLAIA